MVSLKNSIQCRAVLHNCIQKDYYWRIRKLLPLLSLFHLFLLLNCLDKKKTTHTQCHRYQMGNFYIKSKYPENWWLEMIWDIGKYDIERKRYTDMYNCAMYHMMTYQDRLFNWQSSKPQTEIICTTNLNKCKPYLNSFAQIKSRLQICVRVCFSHWNISVFKLHELLTHRQKLF